MTYSEAVTELASVRASISRIVGTKTEGGAQEYSVGSSRIVRAQLETLQKRETLLAAMVKRLNPNDGGGAVRQTIFESRS